MMRSLARWSRATGWALLTLLLCIPAQLRAQDTQEKKANVENYFPANTQMYLKVDINNIFGSQLLARAVPIFLEKYGEDLVNSLANMVPDENAASMMKNFAPQIKEMGKNAGQIAMGMKMVQQQMGPTDFVMAMTKTDEAVPTFVMCIVNNRITVDAFENMAETVKSMGQAGKVTEHKVGDKVYYEMEPPNSPQAIFAMAPEDGVVVMAIAKDVIEGLIKNKGKGKPDPKLATMMAERKKGQTVFFAGINPKADDKAQSAWGHVTLDKDLAIEIKLNCKDADAAKSEVAEMNEKIDEFRGMVGQFADDSKPGLKPLVDSLKNLKAEANGNAVSAKMQLKGDDLINAMKK